MLCGSGGIRTCPRLAERFSRFAVALVAMPFALQPAVAQERPAPLKISIVQSQFRDVPSALVKLSFHPIQTLVKSETTLDSEFRIAKDMDELARQLAGNQVDLGVFHGVEFAWARQKHKDLRPLVIAVNQDRNLRAHLLVAANSPANRFGELQGQALALAKGTRLHCRLFVERPCQGCGQEPEKFFARITTPADAEDALDDVVDGTADVTVVDGVALECYKRRKPGRFAKLRELQVSQVFPCSVIAYHAGHLDNATLRRFKDGMIGAGQRTATKRVLMLWKMTGFEAIPDDYEQTLIDIAKVYPR